MAWTAPKTWSNVLVTVADMNEQVKDNETYLKSQTDRPAALAQAVVTGSRAIDGTVYHNTSDWPMMVLITVLVDLNTTGSQAFITVKCDANASPSTIVGYAGLYSMNAVALGHYAPITFVVPPGYYYTAPKTDDGNASISLSTWVEYTL